MATALNEVLQSSLSADRVQSTVDEYRGFHADTVDKRKSAYMEMVNDYYNLVTDFYEFGWGESFHFAPRFQGESFDASLARHEMYLALILGLRPGMRVLDVGCGVGGPMRTIARFSGASITGVNNNDYQIERARKYNERSHLADRCDVVKADFMRLPMADGYFDAVYGIEATCHAPDKTALFKELHRVLKPGGMFAGYEWCMTDKYRAGDIEHERIKKGIEEGDALPDIVHTSGVDGSLRDAGFTLLQTADLAPQADPETPWYLPLSGRFTLDGWKHTVTGRKVTNLAVRTLERLRIAPKGSTAVSALLNRAAEALVAGGETAIFTPMYFFHAKK
jgi:sterol 24-C-methyltransferase